MIVMPLVSHKTLHEAVWSDFKAKSRSTTFSIGPSIRINNCRITFVNKINLLTGHQCLMLLSMVDFCWPNFRTCHHQWYYLLYLGVQSSYVTVLFSGSLINFHGFNTWVIPVNFQNQKLLDAKALLTVQ